MAKGFVYLCAIIDWHSRKVLAHRVSISMETDFCIDALQEAIVKYGCPEVFNTDQGSQFTSEAFLNELKLRNIRISMDGKGRWMDNVMIERLWRSVKHEEVYLKAYDTVKQAKQSIAEYLDFYKGYSQINCFKVSYFACCSKYSAEASEPMIEICLPSREYGIVSVAI